MENFLEEFLDEVPMETFGEMPERFCGEIPEKKMTKLSLDALVADAKKCTSN